VAKDEDAGAAGEVLDHLAGNLRPSPVAIGPLAAELAGGWVAEVVGPVCLPEGHPALGADPGEGGIEVLHERGRFLLTPRSRLGARAARSLASERASGLVELVLRESAVQGDVGPTAHRTGQPRPRRRRGQGALAAAQAGMAIIYSHRFLSRLSLRSASQRAVLPRTVFSSTMWRVS